MTLRSWLEALGAVGPGHEWAIPLMFPHLVAGIEQSLLLDPAALEYFQLHITLDVEHGKALEESLLRWATTDQHQEEIRRGAERSLDARAAFWSTLSEQLFEDLSPTPAVGWNKACVEVCPRDAHWTRREEDVLPLLDEARRASSFLDSALL